MNDLISRESVLKNIEKIRQSVQMMDDTHRASITMSGMYLCEKAVRNQPSAQPDLCDGCDRYGASCVGEGCGKLEMPEVAKDTNVPNNDCISRQAAIDAVQHAFDRETLLNSFVRKVAVDALKTMPSSQPEITPDGTLNVSIDADIANVGRILLSQTGTQRGGLYYKDEQPEIIHCKDCKHHWIHRCMDSMSTEICDLDQTFYDPNIDFCSMAERRTDGTEQP